MSGHPDYSVLVTQAEQAVASVKDPELKRVAFQKVLDDLLASGIPGSGKSKVKAGRPARRAKRAKRSSGGNTGPKSYVEEMVGDGFFKKQKTIAEVKAELENKKKGQATFLTPSTDALASWASILTPIPPRSLPATPQFQSVRKIGSGLAIQHS